MDKYVLGLDFGSDSARAIVVNTSNGEELASSVSCYKRWKDKQFCSPEKNIYRHHPLDYLESLEECASEAIRKSGKASDIVAIAADTTASTPVLIDKDGAPLALKPGHATNPDAMFVLWKDHSSVEEAALINRACSANDTDYRKYLGGIYDCEWVWSKLMHCLSSSPELSDDAFSFVELCDWIPAILSGNTNPQDIARSRCAAGHKAMWNDEWGGLPPISFFTGISPNMECLKNGLYATTVPGGAAVGKLCREWADKLGLGTDVTIGMGGIDCHVGAVGAGIREGTMVKVIGTSTCDLCVARQMDSHIKGICGEVDGSILPGHIGIEAGQSAFGDIFAWFSRFCGRGIAELTAEAEKLPLRSDSPVAQDWFNGRRSPDNDPTARASISGLSMSTTPAEFFKALVEGAAFGSRAIFERLTGSGVKVANIVATGGIAGKSPFVMQTLSDVIGVKISVLESAQTCALGSAMLAAVAAGVHSCVEEAQDAMKPGICAEYQPSAEKKSIYDGLYLKYKSLI